MRTSVFLGLVSIGFAIGHPLYVVTWQIAVVAVLAVAFLVMDVKDMKK